MEEAAINLFFGNILIRYQGHYKIHECCQAEAVSRTLRKPCKYSAPSMELRCFWKVSDPDIRLAFCLSLFGVAGYSEHQCQGHAADSRDANQPTTQQCSEWYLPVTERASDNQLAVSDQKKMLSLLVQEMSEQLLIRKARSRRLFA